MSLETRLNQDMIGSMKAKDTLLVSVIRMAKTQITNKCKEKKVTSLPDSDVENILVSMVKQRKDSVEQFTKAGRMDLANKEAQEICILESYIPPEVPEDQLESSIELIMMNVGTNVKDVLAKLDDAYKNSKLRVNKKLAVSVINKVKSSLPTSLINV